ncbi:MAG: tRNA (adenosine(37)-N6)-threonylcarbamoyltransferase complex dimerization subunit type 1 TsaB [Deltaproteobacteria bacterium]|nr:tRNA (adenosine(37)-N6)-threonylcarbamoyltransferase complex dimerization subunit type 1 TsaB [Deltaproteobacteria bacterium]MBI4223592.1 tRNA (adenosine(37)-N6)-threonylcarbamoyltransferase complex dimerization subunit type 1 TsaB [Deltaproteobacteria bacterium]
MKILAVDTSTKMGSVALTENESLIAQLQLNVEVTHTERLLPAVETLLNQTGLTLEKVDGLALAIGPGSFTGLRVGLATMKGFAQARGLPLVGVSSLLALACNGWMSERPVAACLDAHRGEVYAAVYSGDTTLNSKGTKCCVPEQAVKPELLCNTLKDIGPCWLIGDGAIRYRQLFKDKLGEAALFAPEPLMRLEAKWVAHLALPRLQKGEGRNWEDLSPNYLRLSDAELKK